MWYRVYLYQNQLFSAKELMQLNLSSDDLVKINGYPGWCKYGNSDFQDKLMKDLGYSISDNGTVHREKASENRDKPSMNHSYRVGEDGILHKHSYETRQSSQSHPNRNAKPKKTEQTTTEDNSDVNWVGVALAIVLPFVIFFGLGGSARDIYFSIFTIDGLPTVEKIFTGNLLAMIVLSSIYCIVAEAIKDWGVLFCLIYVVLILFCGFDIINDILGLIPVSNVVVVIFSIIEIGAMIVCGLDSALE